MFALLLLSAVAQVPASGPTTPLHYKYESKTVTSVDVMGQNQDIKMSMSALLAVGTSDTTGGKIAHVVIDTVMLDDNGMMEQAAAMGPPGMPPGMMANAKGAFFHLYLIDGKPQGKVAPTPLSTQAALAAGAVPLLFPGVKETAKPGDAWSDTTVSDTVLPMGRGKTTAIVQWTVTSKGPDATVLDATMSSTSTIDIGNGMGQMVLNSTGTQHVRLGADGIAREGSNAMTIKGTMTMAMGNMAITGSVASTLTPVP